MMNQGISTEDLSYRKYLPVLDSQWPLLTWGLVSQSCSCMATLPLPIFGETSSLICCH